MPSSTKSPGIDDLLLVDVNIHDIWDQRESAVGNAQLWKDACTSYKSSSHFSGGIPLKMHQIWIGSRQPPCVWLDTWRVEFMSKFKEAPSGEDKTVSMPEWQYILWDNESVQDMPMMNRDLFDAETAPQCQADILRLEVLYKYGGVYVDADIVSTIKDLRPALKDAEKTGFLITYEPDTKDKPYSILGNSIIACTPRHPLILMLMSYIKQIYAFKRAHYGVEWVTGPLTYTKVLVHTGMPITVPPSKDFYPAFHYVPNPSAIDVTKFDSYCFQFGYTCSGLSQWVAENNRCIQAHNCSHHANIEYPLGKLKQFPKEMPTAPEARDIPRIIHQFAFQEESAQPRRWTSTWSEKFCPTNGFRYEKWTWDRLRQEIGSFYCANLYEHRRMDSFSIKMLALEILQTYGGYYVPLTTIFTGDVNSNSQDTATSLFGIEGGDQYTSGSIIGLAANAGLSLIRKAYDQGESAFQHGMKATSDLVADMCYGDDVASLAAFKDGSRYLGAGEMYYIPDTDSGFGIGSCGSAALTWAYDCQVPIFWRNSEDEVLRALKTSKKRAVVITDSQFGVFSSLLDELPGVMYRLDQEQAEWDFILFGVEWEVDESRFVLYKACSPVKAPTARYLGYIINENVSERISSASIDSILELHNSGRIYIASEKSEHSARVSSIFRTMPAIERACRSLAGFEPRFDRDYAEVQGNLFKGFRNSQVAFEMQVDEEQRVMFRSWGDSGGVNCECKLLPGMNGVNVEWLRYYEDNTVAFETTGDFVR